MMTTIKPDVMATISTSIGARFENESGINETCAIAVNVVLDSLTSQDDINSVVGFLLTKGLYTFAAEVKAKNKPDDEDTFRDIMREINAQMILRASQSESKRGRAASDYPQAMRALDYKTIKKFQLKMLEREELVKLPKDFDQWIRPSYLARIEHDHILGYVEGLQKWQSDIAADSNERTAIGKLTQWILSEVNGTDSY